MNQEQQEGKKAFDVCKKLKDNIKQIRQLTIENIPLFEEVLSNEYFKIDMGDENATWAAFLGQPEVTFSRSNVNSWIEIKKQLHDNFGVEYSELFTVKLSKLHTIASYAKNKDHAEELLEAAKTLLPSEWRDLENSLKGKPTADDGHVHEMRKFEQCGKCGFKEPIK